MIVFTIAELRSWNSSKGHEKSWNFGRSKVYLPCLRLHCPAFFVLAHVDFRKKLGTGGSLILSPLIQWCISTF